MEEVKSEQPKSPKILSDDKVDVDIEPDVKSNNVNVQMCTFSVIFNCCIPRENIKK
jgi:hypothetical protein